MKLTEAGCVGCRHQRARRGFNSTDNCFILGPVSSKCCQPSFLLNNIYLCCVGTETKIWSQGSYPVEIVALCFSPSGLIKALDQLQIVLKPLEDHFGLQSNSSTAVSKSISCNKQLQKTHAITSNLCKS